MFGRMGDCWVGNCFKDRGFLNALLAYDANKREFPWEFPFWVQLRKMISKNRAQRAWGFGGLSP